MKKLVNFLTGLLIFTSISVTTACSFGSSPEIKETLSIYENYQTLKVTTTIKNNNTLSSNRVSYLSKSEEMLRGYSTISISSSIFSSKSYQVEEYIYGNDIIFETSEQEYNKKFEYHNSIYKYLGIDEIFNDAKRKSLNGSSVNGEIDASSGAGLVRVFLLDSGYFDDNYNNYFYGASIDYTILFDIDSNYIVSITLDLTEVAKLKVKSANNVIATMVFSSSDKVEDTLDSHPFPEFSNGGGNNISKEQEIKQNGIQYIKDCYEEIEYVNDDLTFYTNSIESARLSFTYESSKPHVISHTGEYFDVEKDEEVTITVHLLYSQIEYETLSFTFWAVPRYESGSGVLGAETNKLYKGRKEIEEVNIYFIEMHEQYGDAIYIQAGDFDMLIDAGQASDGGYVNDFLRRHISDGRLDLVVATHAHGDHIGGMATALSNFKNITYAVDYGYQRSDYGTVTQVRNIFKQADKYTPITDCINNLNGARKVLHIADDLYITFLDTEYYELPTADFGDYNDFNYNLTSVTFIMTYKNQNYYFAGDLEKKAEAIIANNGEAKKVDLAKASHHGSSTSNTANILSVLRPTVSVISTAMIDRGSTERNAQNQTHPIKEALNNLHNYSGKVYCNMTNGTIQVSCDGNSALNVKGLGLSSPYYLDGRAVTGEENYEFRNTKYAKRYRAY